jgi:hypothetical protein
MLTEIKRTARTAGEAYRIIAGGAALGGTSDTTLKGAWELPNGTEIDGASLARITKSPQGSSQVEAWDGENFLRALPLYEDSRIENTITLRP